MRASWRPGAIWAWRECSSPCRLRAATGCCRCWTNTPRSPSRWAEPAVHRPLAAFGLAVEGGSGGLPGESVGRRPDGRRRRRAATGRAGWQEREREEDREGIGQAGCEQHDLATEPRAGPARGGLVLGLRPLHRLPPLLSRLGLLALPLDGWLLVVGPLLHLLEKAVLQHALLQGLQGRLDLVVVDLHSHDPKLPVPFPGVNREHGENTV